MDQCSGRERLAVIFLMVMDVFPLGHFCDPSLVPSCRGGTDEGSQHVFELPSVAFLVWGSGLGHTR